MERYLSEYLLKYVLCTFMALSLVSCLHSNGQTGKLTGKWQEVGKKSYLEFNKDNTFKAEDSMGMTVKGVYEIDNGGKVRFIIRHSETYSEIIDARVTVENYKMTVDYGDNKGVEKYMRVNP